VSKPDETKVDEPVSRCEGPLGCGEYFPNSGLYVTDAGQICERCAKASIGKRLWSSEAMVEITDDDDYAVKVLTGEEA
jgi:hypothetical protein